MHPNLKVLLIGGSSHVGKSTLAESLAARLGWNWISTDALARHPGRPWRTTPETVPDHVAEHYLSLPADRLFEDVLHHYEANVWPKVEAIVASHLNEPSVSGIVLEGSALWPGFAACLDNQRVAALWLTAAEEVFRKRIHDASRYHSKSRLERMPVDKFLERTLIYDTKMTEVVKRQDVILVDVSKSNVEELSDTCLARFDFGASISPVCRPDAGPSFRMAAAVSKTAQTRD